MDKFIDDLHKSKKGVIIAAAGCGKTEIIINAVAKSEKHQLVLTHTHAGVDSLRSRFKKKNIQSSKYEIDTIASWSFKFCKSYPKTSGVSIDYPKDNNDWQKVYEGMIKLLDSPFIQKVLRLSYGALYVDEYQDCNIPQHNIINKVSNFIQVNILGDPLQGIFDFNDRVVDWDKDIFPHFSRLSELKTPWRWIGHGDKKLGEWLIEVRKLLLAGKPIDLNQAPSSVQWGELGSYEDFIGDCKRNLSKTGSIVIIHHQPAQCHKLAQKLGGKYKSMEEMEARDLFKWISIIDKANGYDRGAAILDFCYTVMNKASSEFRSIRNAIKLKKKIVSTRYTQIASLLNQIIQTNDYKSIFNLLVQIEDDISKKRIYRLELWREMKRSIKCFIEGEAEDISSAAWQIRNKTRIVGRPKNYRAISRTLLIKGLEFDHVIIVNPEKFDDKNLYVALTRAKKSLTIWSPSKIINWKKNSKKNIKTQDGVTMSQLQIPFS